MKSKSKIALFAIFATLVVSPLSYIAASNSTRSVAAQDAACATKKDNYKIGFANLTTGVDFITAVEDGMKSAATAAGNVELVIANNNLDGATALNNAENFVAQGVDGVVEFQTDEKFGNVINKSIAGCLFISERGSR